eukprot:CAMPEP_0176446706 /NCGR_PEP_ID=MMETSP0127-20121128/24494_1 /TAXON_ID=938130 /ORGANISM="Platyophrya macrostoma, Strain WH" /LENGTH=407 /DNA_ID=CAMNT_0017832809 /DNA_START=54 /DNA_END=1277 /DNA_ORIENTATION=+
MGKKIAPSAFCAALGKRQFDSFYGVPDSLLKDLCAYVTDNYAPQNHVITANEGNAIGMAAGYHLATGKIPVVYMQNSGIGNTINPLLSLTHREVYQIPMLMLVGWRGDPGKKDEPQHVAQGRLMDACFKSAEVPYEVLEAGDNVEASLDHILKNAENHFAKAKTPYAILIKRDTFDGYKLQKAKTPAFELEMSREKAIELVLRHINEQDIVVSTTGMPSREVFEIRAAAKAGHHRDLLTVGCMGHCSSIAAGIALQKPDRSVYCIDGDGAALMHMGSLAVNGGLGAVQPLDAAGNPQPTLLSNLKHVLINNGAHDSVGGQPTVGFDVSLSDVAKACGYRVVRSEPVIELGDLVEAMSELRAATGPAFLEVLVKKGNRKDLGRPTTTPIQNKEAFETFVRTGKAPSHL